jgi:glucoamylase
VCGIKPGQPTGAAMPLCWSHAEYISLVRSRHDGTCFDRIEPAFQRYVASPIKSHHEFWSVRHPIRRMPHGKILRIVVAAEATIVWTDNGWQTTKKSDTAAVSALDLWFADFPTKTLPAGFTIEFTFFWKNEQRWEGKNYLVVTGEQSQK